MLDASKKIDVLKVEIEQKASKNLDIAVKIFREWLKNSSKKSRV